MEKVNPGHAYTCRTVYNFPIVCVQILSCAFESYILHFYFQWQNLDRYQTEEFSRAFWGGGKGIFKKFKKCKHKKGTFLEELCIYLRGYFSLCLMFNSSFKKSIRVSLWMNEFIQCQHGELFLDVSITDIGEEKKESSGHKIHKSSAEHHVIVNVSSTDQC